VPVTVVFNAPTDLSSYSVVMQGVTGLDFTDAGGGTCSPQTYTAGTSCTVNVAFSPQAPGLVTGAMVIYGPAGAVLGSDNLYGVGDGPVASFTSAVISSYVGTGDACDGTLSSCGDSGSATSATLNDPNAVVFDASGNLYIADTADYAVRKVTPGGTITTIAGSGEQCGSATGACGDGGLAASATFTSPSGVAMDAAGNLYIVDAGANRIREVAAGTGIITTIAGNGNACSSSTAACGDGGAATSATFQMEGHGGAIVDQYANLVIADYGDNRLRSINLNTGIITTVAGTGAACGTPTALCGDGGQATSALLDGPIGVGIDISGDYFIADSNDNRIRKLSALTGVLSTIAGSGTACSSSPCGDGGAATSAELNFPVTATTDPAGNIYIADLNDNTIRAVSASTGLISAVAGNYIVCGTSTAACGDAGAATSANLSHPSGLALNASGNIFLAEATNRVREVNITQPAPLTFTALPNTASAAQPVSLTNVGNAPFTFLGSPSFPTGFGSSSTPAPVL
jgi:sugar lactone lactonase YvrE